MIVGIKDFRQSLTPGRRLLGLDHSRNRIGLALSDADLRLATPLDVLSQGKFTEKSEKIVKICQEYEIQGLVIGLPLQDDGSMGPRAQSVCSFARMLDKRLGQDLPATFPITFIDERYSSAGADDRLQELPGRRGKTMQDAVAACLILEDALRLLT